MIVPQNQILSIEPYLLPDDLHARRLINENPLLVNARLALANERWKRIDQLFSCYILGFCSVIYLLLFVCIGSCLYLFCFIGTYYLFRLKLRSLILAPLMSQWFRILGKYRG